MTEIRHRQSGNVLGRLDAGGLQGALRGADLQDADLRGASLAGAELAGTLLARADLRNADLRRADLGGAYLAEADLRGARLGGADLFGASLERVRLDGSDLSRADLTGAFLPGAVLAGADLTFANLHGAWLARADLAGAVLAFTVFTDCPTLAHASGLGEVVHAAPSRLDTRTLADAVARLPDEFLVGAGLAPAEIRRLRALFRTTRPGERCRIWHTPADAVFGLRLRHALVECGVACHEVREPAGDFLTRVRFEQSLEREDRVLVVCSGAGLLDPRTQRVASEAVHRERETGRRVLFPIVLEDEAAAADAAARGGEGLAALRRRPAADFRGWRDEERFRAALRRLLTSLRRAGGARSSEPAAAAA